MYVYTVLFCWASVFRESPLGSPRSPRVVSPITALFPVSEWLLATLTCNLSGNQPVGLCYLLPNPRPPAQMGRLNLSSPCTSSPGLCSWAGKL